MFSLSFIFSHSLVLEQDLVVFKNKDPNKKNKIFSMNEYMNGLNGFDDRYTFLN